jgi:hypothetical protein
LSLAVNDVSLFAILTLKPILRVQFLNLSNLQPETPDLCTENFDVIHAT